MIYGLPAINKLSNLCLAFSIVLLFTACAGCQTGNSPSNSMSNNSASTTISASLSDDLVSLIKEQAKTTLYEPRYHMVGDLHLVICQFKALPQNINTIANAFDMSEISNKNTLKYIHYDEKNSELGSLFSQGKNVRAYGVFGHPAKLKCKDGKSFDYMLIFYKPETNEASIETSCSTG